MLQNPSKYHANPLSHFLALHHNTQMVHNGRAPIFPPTTINGETINQHLQQQQQHQQNLLPNNNIISYHQPQMQTHNFDASNSSLDAGKSFTIAAILGLQKTAIENNCKDYNNSVINLSMNDGQFENHNHNTCDEQFTKHNNSKNSSNNNNNNNNNDHKLKNNNNNNNKICNFNNNSNRYENDKMALVNRYLPSTNIITTNNTPAITTDQQQQQQQRTNSFVAAAAVAVAAAANVTNGHGHGNAPSALQSLQQLHQHHVQQSNMSFTRDKPKENSKRSALKNKRVRTIFTPEQLERLEAEFERQQYMVGPERLYLAHTLQLTEAQVKVWFQNRRIKWRKHHLEITHQRLALLRQTQVPPNPNAPLDVVNSVGATNLETLGTDDSSNDKYTENRQPSESDLSICNDSVDNDSVFDGAE